MLLGVVAATIAIGVGAVVAVGLAQRSVAADARRDAATLSAARLGERAEVFRLQNGRYPASLDEVGGASPDPWGHPFAYRTTAEGFEIRSLGADGADGGAGADEDIVYTAQ